MLEFNIALAGEAAKRRIHRTVGKRCASRCSESGSSLRQCGETQMSSLAGQAWVNALGI